MPPHRMESRPKLLRPIGMKLLSTQADERLVELVRRGSDEAFEEIVKRYREPLLTFTASIVPYAVAEEVVQGALLRARAALRADRREMKLRPWLFTIARNRALTAIQKERPHSEIGEDVAGQDAPEEAAELNERFEQVVAAICELPPAQRRALVKRELEGAGYAEIAAALGTTATGARGLIFRARTSLRTAAGAMVPAPLLQALIGGGTASSGVAGGAASVGAGLGLKSGATAATAALALGGVGVVGGELADRFGPDENAQRIERSDARKDDSGANLEEFEDEEETGAEPPGALPAGAPERDGKNVADATGPRTGNPVTRATRDGFSEAEERAASAADITGDERSKAGAGPQPVPGGGDAGSDRTGDTVADGPAPTADTIEPAVQPGAGDTQEVGPESGSDGPSKLDGSSETPGPEPDEPSDTTGD